MKTSTKLISTAAASLLGVALAGGAVFATGSLTPTDAPGQVLQVAGVGPVSADAVKEKANTAAGDLLGTTVSASEAADDIAGTDSTAGAQGAQSVESTTKAPVATSIGGENTTGVGTIDKSVSGATGSSVEAVAPGLAVSVDTGLSLNAGN